MGASIEFHLGELDRLFRLHIHRQKKPLTPRGRTARTSTFPLRILGQHTIFRPLASHKLQSRRDWYLGHIDGAPTIYCWDNLWLCRDAVWISRGLSLPYGLEWKPRYPSHQPIELN